METTGCGTALVTPFQGEGSGSKVDLRALHALVNWQIDAGIDFLIACGSTGEAATLDEDEWIETVQAVIEAAAGRVPVWAGCTHNNTRTLLRIADRVSRIRGVDAVLSANPYYNRPTQEGQYQHFLALARAIDPTPVVLYNVPARTASSLEPETVLRLAEAARNIEGIKEAGGKVTQFSALSRLLPDAFKIFSGDDNLALPAIAVGAHGLASVASNLIPAELTRMIQAALHNDWPAAREIERRFARLMEANFWESNPGPVKTILSLMGRCQPALRLPLVRPDSAMVQKLERVAGEAGLLRDAPLPEGEYRMF